MTMLVAVELAESEIDYILERLLQHYDSMSSTIEAKLLAALTRAKAEEEVGP